MSASPDLSRPRTPSATVGLGLASGSGGGGADSGGGSRRGGGCGDAGLEGEDDDDEEEAMACPAACRREALGDALTSGVPLDDKKLLLIPEGENPSLS